jgi:hypothetical protein
MAERPILQIIPAPPGTTLVFLVDAVVVEDDTHLVLGADPVPRETREEPGQLLENARKSPRGGRSGWRARYARFFRRWRRENYARSPCRSWGVFTGRWRRAASPSC